MGLSTRIDDLHTKFVHWVRSKHLTIYSIKDKFREVSPSTKLTKQQKQEIQKVFKGCSHVNLLFHRFYFEKTGAFYPNIIPDDMYFSHIEMYYNDWDKAFWLDDKCLYDRLLQIGGGMARPSTICYCINGFWISPEYKVISEQVAINKIIERKTCFIKKSVDSCSGLGVYFYDGQSESELKAALQQLGNNLIVQEPIKQSEELAKLNQTSVNTIRVLSFLRPDGAVKICSAIVRMGRAGKKVDNEHSGGLTCGIEPDGRLKSVAYFLYGTKFTEHPDSHVKFDEVVVPNYVELCEKIKKMHPLLPYFRLLSWDIGINEENQPVLIEVNLRFGGLNFHQLNNGPVFGDDTAGILDEVFSRKIVRL